MTQVSISADLFRTVYRTTESGGRRPYLEGVFVRANRHGGADVIATNGAMALWGRDDSGTAPEAGVILQTLGHKVPGSDFKGRTLEWDGAHARLVHPDSETGIATNLSALTDWSFPDVGRVVPRGEPSGGPASFQGQYLKILSDVAKDFCRDRAAPVRIWANGNDAARVTFGAPAIEGLELFGVLMPLRADYVPAELPEWMG